MSSLMESFSRRQSDHHRRDSLGISAGTVSSYSISNNSTFRNCDVDSSGFSKDSYKFDACQNVKVGDEITHVNNNFFGRVKFLRIAKIRKRLFKSFITTDSRNLSSFSSVNNAISPKKTGIVMTRKWFLGFIVLIALVCIIPTIIILILWPKQQYNCYDCVVVNNRNTWDALPSNPGLRDLRVPVERVIVTYTADEAESCTTKVRISKLFPRF